MEGRGLPSFRYGHSSFFPSFLLSSPVGSGCIAVVYRGLLRLHANVEEDASHQSFFSHAFFPFDPPGRFDEAPPRPVGPSVLPGVSSSAPPPPGVGEESFFFESKKAKKETQMSDMLGDFKPTTSSSVPDSPSLLGPRSARGGTGEGGEQAYSPSSPVSLDEDDGSSCSGGGGGGKGRGVEQEVEQEGGTNEKKILERQEGGGGERRG